MSDFDLPIHSPCIGNCCLNEDDVCMGCFRSLEAVTQWLSVDNATRRRFIEEAEQRRALHQEAGKEL